MNFLSLFTGIGGIDLGLERAGWSCVAQVEIDPFCRAVLAKHWPTVPRFADIQDVPTELIRFICGRIDCIAGGFACQDISAAGKGAGISRKTRSGLTWRNLFRLARGLRPAWLLIENVPALRTRGYDRIANALERIGYTLRALVVGAEHAGAPHKRHRVWIVGRLANPISSRRDGRTHDTGRQAVERIAAEGTGLLCGSEFQLSGQTPAYQSRNTSKQWSEHGGQRNDSGQSAGATAGSNEELGDTPELRFAGTSTNRREDSGNAGPIRGGVYESSGAGSLPTHDARSCIFPGGCWRCGPRMADADTTRQRERSESTGRAIAGDGSTAMADAGSEGLEGARGRTGCAESEVALPAGGSAYRELGNPECDGLRSGGRSPSEVADERCDRPLWPSRPGQPQHAWEAPRLRRFEQPVGSELDELSADVVRAIASSRGCTDEQAKEWYIRNKVKIDRRQNKEALKAYGNSVAVDVVAAIGRSILQCAGGAA